MQKKILKQFIEFGIARSIIVLFVIVLFILAILKDMQIAELISDSLARIGRNGILVLALLPGVRGGIGLNFGLPLGIICGLIGMLVGMEFDWTGLSGFVSALSIAGGLGVLAGWGYGVLLNKVKGQEMMVGTYVGFSIVSFMCLLWLLLPFSNPKLIWALGGKGLRVTISLADYYPKILDDFLSFSIFNVTIPFGSLLFFVLFCFFVSLFFRSRWGRAIAATGANAQFAKANGINPNQTRVWSAVLSTVLAAIGIVVYNQSFGFVQLYTAPLLMAFPIIACLLIGGAEVGRATITHVILGTVIFQTLLTIALPVTSAFIGGDISETARIIISNGIILYALAGVKGKTA
ncbi:MAG: ABC transporter permease [Deltaproteobacteria bacterium]|nr:ABC transporter permease [Deltaproteobacteria bacterium]